MIITELYKGQGFGNQLWAYVSLRAIALRKGFDFGIKSPEKFKGLDFMTLDFGQAVKGGEGPEGGPPLSLPDGIQNYYVEKDRWHPKYRCDIRDFDPGLFQINDNTKIDGNLQSEQVILPYRKEIKHWLRIKPEYDCMDFSRENLCVLNIRGGEYKGNFDLILRRSYWRHAMANMRNLRADMEFVAVTDDVPYASKLLPEVTAIHFNIGKDYAIVKNAWYLILANSSFSFFPAWTSQTVKYVIAPKFWARHNVSDGFWSCAYNLYQDWMWQDRRGKLFTAEQCLKEYQVYAQKKGLDHMTARPPVVHYSLPIRIVKKFQRLVLKIFWRLFP